MDGIGEEFRRAIVGKAHGRRLGFHSGSDCCRPRRPTSGWQWFEI
jgi:hypothetical protein